MIALKQPFVQRLDLDQLITAARDHASNGDHAAAIALFEPWLIAGDAAKEVYDQCAASLAVVMQDSQTSGKLSEALLRQMLLQPDRFGTLPALHHAIAATHSSGKAQMLPGAAAVLKPLLSRLWDEGCRDRNVLLMVLLLRRDLAGWKDERSIRQWHLDALPDFDLADMSIPYNVMFDKQSFASNVADLQSAMESGSAEELAERFGPWKLILLQAITESNRLDNDIAEIVARCISMESATELTNAAGIRSLILRAVSRGQHVPLPPDTDSGFAQLVDAWASQSARRSSERTPAKAQKRLASKPWQAVRAIDDIVGAKLPFRHARRRPRIALCISGQLRGYKRAYANWGSGLLRGADVEVFVHSWTKIGRSGAESFRAFLPFAGKQFCEAYRTHSHRLGMAETTARYPVLFAALRDTGVVTPGALSAFYGTNHVVLEDDADPRFADWSNSRKMHYKVAAAADMIGEDDSFDLVLRIRPDKALGLRAFSWPDLLAATRDGTNIYADAALGHQYGRLLIGDQLAIGAPRAMRIYADSYRMMPRLAEAAAFGCRDQFHGHATLATQCWHGGVDVRRLPVKTGALLEAEPLPSAAILACLERDIAGRGDAIDGALVDAVRFDLARG
jgi:hypothetical protein